MKKIYYPLIATILILGACHPTYVVQESQPSPAPVQQQPEVSYQNFYDELSPYGHWIDYPGYGYVWMPAVGPDFKPYATNGYWIYTDMGWTWASNYSWGWAPFHYGRWFYEGGYGWMWMPGNEWSPAWVSWRSNNDYYGWAPLGPNVRMDVYSGSYNPPSNYWCFVPHQYISSPRINNYYVNETRNVTIINNTTIINTRVVNVTNNNNPRANNNAVRTVYVNGPDRQEVERVTGSSIRPAVIRENNRPGEQVSNDQYTIYRPHVNSTSTLASGNQARVAPSRVESLRDIRPVSSPNSAQENNNQPVIRSNNNSIAPANNNPSSNNNTRPPENAPSSNVRTQKPMNDNQQASNRNDRFIENQPANRTNANANATTPVNNQPANTRFDNRNNSSVNNNNAPATNQSANTARPVNNNARANTQANNNTTAPANNVRTNNGPAHNNNKTAEQINQMRKQNAAAASKKPLHEEKKEKKDE